LALLAVLAAPDAGALTAQHRLDRVVVPTSEALRLELDAAQTDYSGTAHIALKVTARPTRSSSTPRSSTSERWSCVERTARRRFKWTEGPHGVLTVHAPRSSRPVPTR